MIVNQKKKNLIVKTLEMKIKKVGNDEKYLGKKLGRERAEEERGHWKSGEAV